MIKLNSTTLKDHRFLKGSPLHNYIWGLRNVGTLIEFEPKVVSFEEIKAEAESEDITIEKLDDTHCIVTAFHGGVKRNEDTIRGASYSHKSYAVCRAARVNGMEPHLFGSTVPHPDYIELSISPAEIVVDDYTGERFYRSIGRSYIRVKMTRLQFADMITTTNTGDGFPCTLDALNGQKIRYQHHTDHDYFTEAHNALTSCSQNIASNLEKSQNEIEKILNKKNINKGDREQIRNILDSAIQGFHSDVPYLSKVLDERKEEVLSEAKSVIDSMESQAKERIKNSNGLDSPVTFALTEK